MAEIEAGWVERELDGCRPEIPWIASAMAAVAVEEVVVNLDREAVGRVPRTMERIGTAPLVTTDSERDVVQLFEHRADGDQSAQHAVVETRHIRDQARLRKTWATRRVPRQPSRVGRVWLDGHDRTCP